MLQKAFYLKAYIFWNYEPSILNTALQQINAPRNNTIHDTRDKVVESNAKRR